MVSLDLPLRLSLCICSVPFPPVQVFYRNAQQTDFEAAREDSLKGVVTRMQTQARRFIVRCRYKRWARVVAVLKDAIAARTLEKLEVRLLAAVSRYDG